MSEAIPLVIGKQSSGEAQVVYLASLPNVFISHSHHRQLPDLFVCFVGQLLQEDKNLQFAVSLNSRLAGELTPMIPVACLRISFLHQEYEEGKINSIEEFIKQLAQERKNRKALYKKRAAAPGLPPLVVFMDDIFEVIMSVHKKTALLFIELLIAGAAVEMYFIMGSSGIYRNLLQQMINVTPSLQMKLNKTVQVQNFTQPLGAEMVMNPDGLIFFRERGEKEYMRLYPEGNDLAT